MRQQNSRRARVSLHLIVLLPFSASISCMTSVPPESNSNNHTSPSSSPTATSSIRASPIPDSPTPNETLSARAREQPLFNPNVVGQSFVGQLELIIPVAGVQPDDLRDTFSDARSDGRTHDAIDIPAAAGTSVLAVSDGRIVKLFQSEPGGTTIYQLSADEKLIFYYAHLQGYASGLAEGKLVRQGEVIGYVGDTGNAGAGNYHLHFSIAIAADPKRYWEGTYINPYPLLKKR